MQMKVYSEQRAHTATKRADESRDAGKRREDEHKEAARVREDDCKETERVRADDCSERALDWIASITLISGIASGYFTIAAEVQGVKIKKAAENEEEGEV